MKIDNSQAVAFRACPHKWQETYQKGIQKRPSEDGAQALEFGKRIHQKLATHFAAQGGLEYGGLDRPNASESLENETEEMFQAYVAHYPGEDFDVLAVEKYFEVPLPASPRTGIVHTYCGKRDADVRDQQSGRLRLLEHKSEARGGKDNLPISWAARSQVSLYLYSGGYDYNEPFSDIILDVLTRRSPAGRIPCYFRRDNLQRSPRQIALAVRDIVYVADKITELQEELGDSPWPEDTNSCSKWGMRCEFYQLHVDEEGDPSPQTIEQYYMPTENYLGI